MNASNNAIVMLALIAFASCGALDTSAPTDDEMQAGLSSFVQRNSLTDLEIVQAHANSCQPGKVGNTNVKVCSFCVVSASVQSNPDMFKGGGSTLRVVKETGSVAMVRALSLGQPNVSPAGGQRGVFVPVDSTWQFDQGKQSADLTPDLLARTGFKPQTGWNAWMQSSMGGTISDEVRQRLRSDESLRSDIANLVGSCTGASPPQPQQSNSSSPKADVSRERIAKQSEAAPASADLGRDSSPTLIDASSPPSPGVTAPFAPPKPVVVRGSNVRFRAAPAATDDIAILAVGSDGEVLNVVGIVNKQDWSWYALKLPDGRDAYVRSDLTSAPVSGQKNVVLPEFTFDNPPPAGAIQKVEVAQPSARSASSPKKPTFDDSLDTILETVERPKAKAPPIEERSAADLRTVPDTAPRQGAGDRQRMTITIADFIRDQLLRKGCWMDQDDMPDAKRLRATIRVKFGRDGKFLEEPQIVEPAREPAGDTQMQMFIARARSGLDKCNQLGFQVPSEYYEHQPPQGIDIVFLP